MDDRTGFIAPKEMTKDDLRNLLADIQEARTQRGWPNAPVSFDDLEEVKASDMNKLRTAVTYGGYHPRYVAKEFPAYNLDQGAATRANFLNEVRLVVNDTRNKVGCSSGCTSSCYNLSKGGEGCGNTCEGGCSTACDGDCESSCDDSCLAACGGNCASGCTGCHLSCSSEAMNDPRP